MLLFTGSMYNFSVATLPQKKKKEEEMAQPKAAKNPLFSAPVMAHSPARQPRQCKGADTEEDEGDEKEDNEDLRLSAESKK
jgi:hypothetical protein